MLKLFKLSQINSYKILSQLRSYSDLISPFYSNHQLTVPMPNHKSDLIYVGMSGGVDSSVTAYLLKEKGYQVEGIYMRNWDSTEEGDASRAPCETEWQKVQDICKHINIPCQRISFVKEYWTFVFERMLEDYQSGWTPNPDLTCNREIKFHRLLNHLKRQLPKEYDNAWLATGHYARVFEDKEKQTYHLFRGVDPVKDQTYYLATIQSNNLKNVIFPLGSLYKSKVKEIARSIGLNSIADQKESMGICFVGKRKKFSDFLEGYIVSEKGKILTEEGISIGEHEGIWSYTLGQRIRLSYNSKKYYVIEKDILNNSIIVAPNRDHPKLYKSQITIHNFEWLHKAPHQLIQGHVLPYSYKLRSTQSPQTCYLKLDSLTNRLDIFFLKPERGIAPGQFFVLYDRDECLGAAMINTVN